MTITPDSLAVRSYKARAALTRRFFADITHVRRLGLDQLRGDRPTLYFEGHFGQLQHLTTQQNRFQFQIRLTQTPCLGLGELRSGRQDLYRCKRSPPLALSSQHPLRRIVNHRGQLFRLINHPSIPMPQQQPTTPPKSWIAVVKVPDVIYRRFLFDNRFGCFVGCQVDGLYNGLVRN